jgi:hypothetical protein
VAFSGAFAVCWCVLLKLDRAAIHQFSRPNCPGHGVRVTAVFVLLQNQRDKLIVLVEALLLHGTISAEQFSGLVNIPLKHTTEGPLEPWHDLWFEFRSA